jgi:hypothetical protein
MRSWRNGKLHHEGLGDAEREEAFVGEITHKGSVYKGTGLCKTNLGDSD